MKHTQLKIIASITILCLSAEPLLAMPVRGGSAGAFTRNLTEAISNASSGSVIDIAAGNFQLNRQITLSKPVILNGAGRGRTTISYSGPRLANRNGLFRLEARNIRFQNMRLRGSSDNVDRNIGNIIRAARFGNAGNGCRGLRVTSCRFERYTDTGVGHHDGIPLSGLIATSCIFDGARQGINYLNRRTNRGPGFVGTMARGEVRNCEFRNIRDNLVSIDCANDAEGRITNFSDTLIIGNSMTGVVANPHSITYSSNIIVENNTATAGRDAVHTEYRCRNLLVRGNTLSGRNGVRFGVGDGNVYVLRNGVETRVPRDANVIDAHFNGSRDCRIVNNTFIDTTQAAVELIECESIVVARNNFNQTNPRGEAKIRLVAARGDRFRRGCINCVVRDNAGANRSDVSVDSPGQGSQNQE